MWCLWIIVAFVANGLAQFGLRVAEEMNLVETHAFLYLAFWFVSGFVAGIAIYWLTPQRPPIRRIEIIMGAAVAACNVACWFFMSAAFAQRVPAYLALPVSMCGSISLVAVVGVLLLKERLVAYGCLGIVACVGGIALLVST